MNAKVLCCAAALAAGFGLAAPSFVMPALAEMTKMVGGAPMYPSKNIVENGLQRLDEEKRAVVLLAYYRGLSREALAKRFGRPVATIKTWVHRSLGKPSGPPVFMGKLIPVQP